MNSSVPYPTPASSGCASPLPPYGTLAMSIKDLAPADQASFIAGGGSTSTPSYLSPNQYTGGLVRQPPMARPPPLPLSSSSSSSSCTMVTNSALPPNYALTFDEDEEEVPLNFVLKAKRKRATPEQVHVLNQVFEQTYFPSTEVRRQLALQLSMTPRTVQIWFQNKRQALRTRNKTQGHFHPHHRNPPTSLRGRPSAFTRAAAAAAAATGGGGTLLSSGNTSPLSGTTLVGSTTMPGFSTDPTSPSLPSPANALNLSLYATPPMAFFSTLSPQSPTDHTGSSTHALDANAYFSAHYASPPASSSSTTSPTASGLLQRRLHPDKYSHLGGMTVTLPSMDSLAPVSSSPMGLSSPYWPTSASMGTATPTEPLLPRPAFLAPSVTSNDSQMNAYQLHHSLEADMVTPRTLPLNTTHQAGFLHSDPTLTSVYMGYPFPHANDGSVPSPLNQHHSYTSHVQYSSASTQTFSLHAASSM